MIGTEIFVDSTGEKTPVNTTNNEHEVEYTGRYKIAFGVEVFEITIDGEESGWVCKDSVIAYSSSISPDSILINSVIMDTTVSGCSVVIGSSIDEVVVENSIITNAQISNGMVVESIVITEHDEPDIGKYYGTDIIFSFLTNAGKHYCSEFREGVQVASVFGGFDIRNGFEALCVNFDDQFYFSNTPSELVIDKMREMIVGGGIEKMYIVGGQSISGVSVKINSQKMINMAVNLEINKSVE